MTAAAEIATAVRRAWSRGWMPATSGNVSVRRWDGAVLITESGRDKETFEPEHVLVVDQEGRPETPGRVASAETLLHLARYAADPSVGAVLHVHAAHAVLASRRFDDRVRLAGFELLKAFPGMGTHEGELLVPIVENSQDMAELAPIAEAAVARSRPCWGYLVRGHGLYTWGETLRAAERHAEAFDHLFHYALEEAR